MNSHLNIRPYTAADLDGVVTLWRLAFPDEPAWNESFALIERKLRVQPELFFVCVDGSQVVGTVIAVFDGVRGWVHKVASHPQRTRSGIARRLMQAAEQGLAELGCTKLNLQVRVDNNSALAFYQAAGYTIEDRVSLGKRLRGL
jgi:ribosomal protein S18 acetylase RimI-like enzyme